MATIHIKCAEEIVKSADDRGKEFSKTVKTHQLRNFYAGVTQIRQDWKNKDKGKGATPGTISSSLVMLKPKLAYAAGRQLSVRSFFEFVSKEIDETRNMIKVLGEQLDSADEQDQQDIKAKQAQVIENFFALIEGVVAYHKFYGGQD